MKNILKYLAVFLVGSIIIVSCKKDEPEPDPDPQQTILPKDIAVSIPNAISYNASSGKTSWFKTTEGDTLNGEDIYDGAALFIAIGEQSAKIVNAIIFAIIAYDINEPMELDYTSDDDGREKHLSVTEDASYEGETYEFKLLVTDGQDNAMAIYWNQSPKEGVAILSPYDINRNEDPKLDGVLYKIEYSETGASGYSKDMIVTITGFPEDPTDNASIDNLRMFAGKNGNIIDVYGNSNHPNIQLVDTTFSGGRNYAFIARGNSNEEIGICEVALPPSSLTSTSNMLDDYSIIEVITEEANNMGITDSAAIAAYLSEADAPGYFIDPQGLVSSGTDVPSHPGFTSSFIDISALTPYVPNDVKNQMITWE